MKKSNASGSFPLPTHADAVVVDGEGVLAMRHCLHELGNVLTGVMIAGGLLAQYLDAGPLQHYASDICEGSERGCGLVREIRSRLLNACGEVEVETNGRFGDSSSEQ